MDGPTPRHAPLRLALLAVALIIVGVVAFHPHWNLVTGESRGLTTHMDAYVHWGRSQAAVDQGTVAYREPFAPSGSQDEFTFRDELHERGYHAYLGTLQDATGIDWVPLWKFIPLATTLLLALALFALAERWGAGVEAALWVAAIPTTLRFLGPAFMVPVAFGLPLFVAGLFALFHLRGRAKLATVFVLIAALWPIHTMPALALTAIAALDALLSARREPLSSLLQLALVALPLLVVSPYITQFLESRPGPQELPPGLVEMRLPGIAFFLLLAVGGALLAARRPTWRPGLLLSAVVLTLGWLAVARHETANDVLGIYDRSLMIVYVLGAVLAGVAVAGARDLLLHARLRSLRPVALVAVAAVLAGQVAIIGAAAHDQMTQEHYYILDEGTYARYEDVADQLPATHEIALVDGTGTMGFTIATGRPLAFTFYPSSPGVRPDVAAFFDAGASDTRYLVDEGITIVVTERAVENPDLREVARGVYLLRDDYAERIAAARRVLAEE